MQDMLDATPSEFATVINGTRQLKTSVIRAVRIATSSSEIARERSSVSSTLMCRRARSSRREASSLVHLSRLVLDVSGLIG